jgi:hypothetical protein
MATVQPIHSTVSRPSGVCRGCGDPFFGHKRKYCTTACGQRFKYLQRAPRRLIVCQNCGKEFMGALRYCSKECRERSNRDRSNRRFAGKCEFCGNDFQSGNSERFCSIPCANRSIWKNFPAVKKVCKCGKKFKTKKPLKTWCSRNCWNRARLKRKWAYYKAAFRMRKRQEAEAFIEQVCPTEIFSRDNWTCQICSKEIDMEKAFPHPKSASLDHIIPISKGGTHEAKNVQCAHLRCNIRKSNKGTEFQPRLF